MTVCAALAPIALLCLALPGLSKNATAETVVIGPRHAHLYAVADAFDRAQLAQDRATLERMVDDGLVFIQASGQRADKKAFIDGWTTPGDRYDPVKLSDREIVPLGPDAFLISAYAELSGTSSGKRFSSSFRFTDTFRRVGGEWRAVHIQVTRIAG
ncbi:nuclear transport factor 2 family protein [Sphingomonas sp.]|uniref:nuclear transport factor 2 family protein n=1 Tax=Sphingomonas sp. TaxID=28214 RepID=UPI0031D3F579